MFQNFPKSSWMKLQWMKQITLFFTVQALRRKSGVYIFQSTSKRRWMEL